MISGKNFLQISKKFILVLALFLFLVRIFCKSVVYGLSISLQKPSILLGREKWNISTGQFTGLIIFLILKENGRTLCSDSFGLFYFDTYFRDEIVLIFFYKVCNGVFLVAGACHLVTHFFCFSDYAPVPFLSLTPVAFMIGDGIKAFFHHGIPDLSSSGKQV